MPRRSLALLIAIAGLAGCGGSPGSTPAVSRTIVGFSEAAGPAACDYLTPGAQEELFLGRRNTATPKTALAACRRRAVAFSGAPARVTRVWFPRRGVAMAFAQRPGTGRSYVVTLARSGPGWLIDKIGH